MIKHGDFLQKVVDYKVQSTISTISRYRYLQGDEAAVHQVSNLRSSLLGLHDPEKPCFLWRALLEDVYGKGQGDVENLLLKGKLMYVPWV